MVTNKMKYLKNEAWEQKFSKQVIIQFQEHFRFRK
jgi:hypothetical protein